MPWWGRSWISGTVPGALPSGVPPPEGETKEGGGGYMEKDGAVSPSYCKRWRPAPYSQ